MRFSAVSNGNEGLLTVFVPCDEGLCWRVLDVVGGL